MTPIKVAAVTLLAGSISIGVAIFGQHWLGDGPLGELAGERSERIQTLPDFRLPDLSGREIASSAWAGKVLVLNYWASWCPPCVREMPALIDTQTELGELGLQVVGIAVDRPADVERFVEGYPVNYPILIADPQAIELSKRLGNRVEGLPFTVIFDRHGRRVFSRTGELSRAELREQVGLLMQPGAGLPMLSSGRAD